MAGHLRASERSRLGPRDLPSASLNPFSLPTPLFRGNHNDGSDDGDDGKRDGRRMKFGEDLDKSDNKGDNDNSCVADHSPNPPPLGCFAVNDVATPFSYTGDWLLSSLDGNGMKGTSHQATSKGPIVNITFDGSGIVLLGIVPQSSSDNPPPAASYSIDGGEAVISTLPFAQMCTRNQVFFKMQDLTQGNHTLTINVTAATKDAPYIIDYTWICGGPPPFPNMQGGTNKGQGSAQASQSSRTNPPDNEHEVRNMMGVIIGSVLGGVVLLLLIAFLAWFLVRRRRRQQRLRQLHIAASPVASWLRWQSDNSDNVTVFTSTESILRNNPAYSSSASKSTTDRGSNRHISAPPTTFAPPGLLRKSIVPSDKLPPLPPPPAA